MRLSSESEASLACNEEDTRRHLRFSAASSPGSTKFGNKLDEDPIIQDDLDCIVLSEDGSDMEMCSDDDRNSSPDGESSPSQLNLLLTKSSGAPKKKAPVRKPSQDKESKLDRVKHEENWGIGSSRRNTNRDITMSAGEFSKRKVELSSQFYIEFN